jgi:hypothetical protein
MAMEAITFHAAPERQEPFPLANDIIATISNTPARRYVVWNRVLITL